jgi:hypothetical protein
MSTWDLGFLSGAVQSVRRMPDTVALTSSREVGVSAPASLCA